MTTDVKNRKVKSEYQEITPELLKGSKIEIDVKPPVIPIEKNEGFKTELPEEWPEEWIVDDYRSTTATQLRDFNQLIQALHERDERVSEQGKELNSAIMTIGELSIQVMRLEKQVKELREGRAK